jgi:hypothetical protein
MAQSIPADRYYFCRALWRPIAEAFIAAAYALIRAFSAGGIFGFVSALTPAGSFITREELDDSGTAASLPVQPLQQTNATAAMDSMHTQSDFIALIPCPGDQ